MSMAERERVERERAAERLPVVLERLRQAPTDSLRWELRDLLRTGVTVDPAVRRTLAEHYRAVRSPDQAARWGIGIPGWARASEIRALRLTLLERVPYLDASWHLDLEPDAPVPPGIADVMVAGPDPKPAWWWGTAAILGAGGALGAVAGVVGVAFGVVVRIVDGTPGRRARDRLTRRRPATEVAGRRPSVRQNRLMSPKTPTEMIAIADTTR